MSSSQQDIDQLLERYLTLLDEYTELRKELSKLQSEVFHNIARANFSGERGLRYGQDQYDDRMRASRRVAIAKAEDDVFNFTVARATSEGPPPAETGGRAAHDEDTAETSHERSAGDVDTDEASDGEQVKGGEVDNDPLRWFGILTPMPLRTAQSHSVRVVEDVIPRLVSVNAEMRHVEIDVRRARKRKAKAEAAKSKVRAEEAAGLLGRQVEAS
ncbi:hypothetical protein ED733_006587 [Metarhizium rileyi]|uniref:Vacuolar ATPase assembly protein VMA22 n=1 Tax=Metarhizium rileyi (strain RCEF 4871) TaxID=1649241 RepID=A0A5C6GB93_METRR|nr:hypothetical protein ED733_006587 [Metarhizium rileyi]